MLSTLQHSFYSFMCLRPSFTNVTNTTFYLHLTLDVFWALSQRLCCFIGWKNNHHLTLVHHNVKLLYKVRCVRNVSYETILYILLGLPSPRMSSLRNQRRHQEPGIMVSVSFQTLKQILIWQNWPGGKSLRKLVTCILWTIASFLKHHKPQNLAKVITLVGLAIDLFQI